MKRTIYILTVAVAALLMTGCKTTKVVEVMRTKTDTTYIVKHHRDSIYVSDSIYINDFVRDDTVFIVKNRWQTKFIERTRTDTVVRHQTDTVPAPYPVEVEVPAKLTWWQVVRLNLMNAILIIGLVVFILFVFHYLLLFKKNWS